MLAKLPFKKLYVQPPTLGADRLFHEAGYDIIHDPKKADVIVFCGGSDIDPAFYGQKKLAGTYTSPGRDKEEKALWEEFTGKKPMLGICRGGQFLNAMAGGDMWQDVNNHGGNPHAIYLMKDGKWTGEVQFVNTVHHQMMIPASSGIVLAAAYESTRRTKEGEKIQIKRPAEQHPDPEIIFYPEQGYYCFQAHPEFGHPPTTELFFKQVKELF